VTDRLQYWQRGRLIFGAELGSREKLVLLAISDHLGSNATAWPSHARLARRCGMTRRTIVKSMRWLEAHEVLTVQRVAGQSSRCSINIDWLKAHQCQDFTREADSHVKNIHTPCEADSHPPVSDVHTPCEADSHKGDQEGDQEKEIRKEIKTARKTARKTKSTKLTLTQVKAIPIPAGLPAGYPAAFQRWVDVRSGDHWRKAASQTEAFHAKMLKAHQQRKDVMAALERAHELGWSGIKAGWMDDLPIQVAVDTDQTRRPVKTRAERLADYRKSLEIS
jgi:hypothetical protein